MGDTIRHRKSETLSALSSCSSPPRPACARQACRSPSRFKVWFWPNI